MQHAEAIRSSVLIRPPRRSSSLPAFLAAVLMHAALVGAMWIAVQWHTSAASPAVAVLWDLPDLPPEPPQPVPTTTKAPDPVPTPPPPQQQPVQPQKPDIALKVEKHPKKPPRPEPPPKAKPEPAAHPKPADDAHRAKLAQDEHDAEMARLANQLGRPGPVPMAGTSGRPSTEYEARVRSAVLANLHFAPPEGGVDGIYAEYEVHLLPATGEQSAEPRLTHPSGLPGWDDAVRRAILRTDPCPRRADGSAPRTLNLRFYPQDIR